MVIRAIKFFTDKINPTGFSLNNDIISSLVISAVVGLGFFSMIRYSLRKYDKVPRLKALKQAFETTVYFFILWFPMVIFICGKILFRKKDMNWGKTAHGLVLEEEQKVIFEEKSLKENEEAAEKAGV